MKRSDFEFTVKVLQNGSEVASLCKPLGSWSVGISNLMGSRFTVPHYRIPRDSLRFVGHTGHVSVTIEGPWSGLIQTKKKLYHGNPAAHEPTLIDLSPGDLGAMQFHGLDVIWKFAKPALPKKIKLSSKYRGSFFTFLSGWFPHPMATSWAIVLSMLIVGGVSAGFLARKDFRPTHLSELPPNFTLAMIAPENLKTLPEALNEKLQASNYIGQTILYYESLVQMEFGEAITASQLLYPSSISLAREKLAAREEEIAHQMAEMSNLDQASANDPNKAKIALSASLPYPLSQQLFALNDKVHNYQVSLQELLDHRKLAARQYGSDKPYDYSEYFNGKQKSQLGAATKSMEPSELSKIKIEGLYSEEEKIYLVADNLAARAEKIQEHRRKSKNSAGEALRKSLVIFNPNELPLAMSPDSFAMVSEDMLNSLRGTTFGQKAKPVRTEEIATGIIDPNAVESIIAENQFRLRLCFEAALRRNQNAKGSMQWRWRIDTGGRPQNLQLVFTSIEDQTMVRCIRNVMLTWVFPQPKNGSVLVNRSFEFQAEAG